MIGNNFNILVNLPLIIFAIGFFGLFLVFLWGGIILLRAKKEPMEIRRGKRVLFSGLVVLLILLIIMFVFYLVSFLLQKWEKSRAVPGGTEFPPSPAVSGFPPPPQSIRVGDYYFAGPFLIKKIKSIKENVVYAILCKEDKDYVIIDIEVGSRINFLKNSQYNCWLRNCEGKSDNLYVAFLRTWKQKYKNKKFKK